MATRTENERKFKQWIDNSDGTRTYRCVVQGRHGWSAHYVKIVDADENTISFRQEVYDDNNTLAEIHEKFPTDSGHEKLKG
jgi:hypothetical protein